MHTDAGCQLMLPYWSDVKNELWFYKKGGIMRKDYVYDDVLNSPLVPIQVLNEEGFFHNASPQVSTARRRIVFALGMYRCGTSLLMSCLAELGCSIGKTKNQDHDWQTPRPRSR